ncbi:flagellar motor protein [Sinimarinibacterium sp. NLF-5-8]|uniref:flagellar motor protein n=1 Tax=Sinimarinibacterium sp. NLF-5-8 TaxID=2698684 RepID=UPI00137BBBED|nr:flagellar motor protein [Sinimarinibacterium sp. NLF-5-8]QHS08715.1 flagellar motor protein [Sinimarinibacterium sp. NLF-5-8]
MDKLSVIGVVLALFALIVGSILKGAGVASLVNSAAFTIVVIGTTASILLHTPPVTFKHGMRIVKWAFKPPLQDPAALIARIVEWSGVARKQGLLALESVVQSEEDPFLKKGLQMLVDGTEPEMIRNILEVELQTSEHFDQQGAKVFEGMGIYAPTLGIIGAVLGLIAVMKNLADPSKLGPGIAAAFTATIYGIGLANLFFLPIANKLKAVIADQVRMREMMIEGLIAISQGENPRNIEVKLQGFVH